MQVALWTAVAMLVVVLSAWLHAVTGVGHLVINIYSRLRIKMTPRKNQYPGRHRA